MQCLKNRERGDFNTVIIKIKSSGESFEVGPRGFMIYQQEGEQRPLDAVRE